MTTSKMVVPDKALVDLQGKRFTPPEQPMPPAPPMITVADFIESLPEEVPDPVGHKILLAVFDPPEQTRGGIIKPDDLRSRERYASQAGLVLALGPDAYKDEKRFPNGQWCRESQWVVFAKYTGGRLNVTKKDSRDTISLLFLDDDQILGTVPHPGILFD